MGRGWELSEELEMEGGGIHEGGECAEKLVIEGGEHMEEPEMEGGGGKALEVPRW